MAIKHSITLSTTEPNNEVGVIKIRQADEQTQTLEVQITENGVPKSYQGLAVYFCAKLGQTAGLGIIEQKLKPEEMTSPANGKLEYTMRAEDWQTLGRQKGYFSFRKMKDEHEFVEQFTTRDFTFDVIKSVYSDGLKEVKKDGSTYVWTIEDLIRLFNEYMASGKSDWEEFVEQNREILESVDPGGIVLRELLDARKPFGGDTYPTLAERLDNSDQNQKKLFDYTIKLYKPYFLFDGSDESAKLQAILDEKVNWQERVTLELPSGVSIGLSNLIIDGRLAVTGNNATIISNAGGFLFKNKSTSGAILTVSDITLHGLGLADLQMTKDVDSSLRIRAKNIMGYGKNENEPAYIFYRGASNDFVNFENISLYFYEKGIEFLYNSSINRMSTQLRLANIDVHYVKRSLLLNGNDKITLDNIDMQRIGCGIEIGQYVRRLNARAIHFETIGNYVDTNCTGIYVNNANEVIDLSFSQLSFLLPLDTAKNSIFITHVPGNLTQNDKVASIRFTDVTVADAQKQPVVLNGFFVWDAIVPQADAIIFNSGNSRVNSGRVINKTSRYVSNINLLPVNKISQTTDFTVANDVSLTQSGYFAEIKNLKDTQNTLDLRFECKSSGWYTFMFNGDLSSIDDNIRIMRTTSPYTTYKTAKILNGNKMTNLIYFYVNEDAAHTISIRFDLANQSKLIINDVGVFLGFKEGY